MKSSPYCSLLTGFFFGFVLWEKLTGIAALQITHLSVPPWIESGSKESVVLDCEYDLTEKDKSLVVKWFLNNDPEPIYQWIPELKSRHFSYRLEGRVSLNYTVFPSDEYTKYRAIKILRPTIDLSGLYTCTVGSLSGTDSKDKQMIVYSPPTVFMLNYTYISSDKERLRCQAEGVFPLPRLVLYEMTSHSRSRQLTTNLFQNEQLDFTGAYIVEVSKDLTTEELKGDEPRVFKCVLTIPGTEYLAERSVVFYPDATGGHDVAVCVTTALLITSLSIIRLVA
ncbi:hemicentin-1-like isoform X1 [Limulus polyphemus]|uniref:Hemicentin-1-like isoform X1 n=1 Tax=Limulus polyphemus TaxID=6850 RepID=A0ABM1B9W8_LIMPO|nr:hemicentin-1-like isoform X1 [Limulus polyphemus]